ncbi:MAG: nitroreductase [Rhizobiales bacterium]|nr:nitroreductase [Hyphomicrobiales bacterium]
MDAHDAIMTRRSVRRYLPAPVPEDSLHRILKGAGRAPSGHNIQPWRVYVLTGAAKDRVSKAMLNALDNDPPEDHQPEFDYYPTEWIEPFLSRRRKVGLDLYGKLGIAREDKAARDAQMRENYTFFGAPVGIFVTIDRRLATGTFMDIGMFLENIFVGARSEGLDTCGQACFNWFHKVIRAELPMAETELLACGLSLGYADPDAPENQLQTDKLKVEDYTVFLD